MQPLIAPLYDGRTPHEVLATFIDAQNGKSAHDSSRITGRANQAASSRAFT